MSAPTESGSPACSTPSMDHVARMWGSGWRRYFFPGFWLIYLGQTIDGVGNRSHGAAAVVGYVLVALFAAVYLAALPMGWEGAGRRFWVLYGLGFALCAAEGFFAGPDALVFGVYLAVLTIASRASWRLAVIGVMTVLVTVLPAVVPGWGGAIDWSDGLTVLLVSLAMFGFFKVIQSNILLTAARAEVARLAAENERSRIARDLHDLLGHSLTTITVKAGLARRLAERGDADRALIEITEVEQLSRRTLGDVRAAVSAHHEVTLAGEIATAREVLRAAGVVAELPPSVAESDPALSELFGWAVREGITNVVRHAHADHVRVAVGPNWVEITDDGDGPSGAAGQAGNGLRGLRQRADAAGGTLLAASTLRGFTLRVEVPRDAPARSAGPSPAPAVPARVRPA